jgi:uncharacterized membrane protein YphA (DoxX/SURF4 family)
MDITLWVLQAVLAAVFAHAGIVKLTRPIDSLSEVVGGWVYDVPAALIRTVAALEIAGAAGLVLPGALDIAPWLTWVAALGLVVTMLGAMVVHGRRGERKEVFLNLLLAALLGLVVWGRSGPYGF